MELGRRGTLLFVAAVSILVAGSVVGLVLTRDKGSDSGKARRTVCIDPGHSTVGGPASVIDPATGLDVADGGGEPGEAAANWELALKVKEKLEKAGYAVRLTKDGPDSYADLRDGEAALRLGAPGRAAPRGGAVQGARG
jgi:hypothetical protein